MIVYRIAKEDYKDDISGTGAALYGARWNSRGTKMLYTSEHISLCILEALVHFKERNFPPDLYLLKIDFPTATASAAILPEKIKSGWANEPAHTQWIGDQFARNNETLLLKVPSVVVPEEFNYLLNPLHKDFKKVKIISSQNLELDKRLEMSL